MVRRGRQETRVSAGRFKVEYQSAQHVYVNKQTATRAAKLEWEKIRERRDIIAENNEAALNLN